MRTLLILAAATLLLLATSLPAPVARAAAPVPRVVIVVGPAGGVTPRYPRAGERGGQGREGRGRAGRQGLLAQCDVAGGQGGHHRRVDRRLPGSRQRLAVPLPRRALPALPERVRAEPRRGFGRQLPPVLRRGVGRQRPARGQRGRAPQPPLLRQWQHRAGPPRGRPRPRDPARRQLRRRVHPGRREGRRRRGAHGARVLRPCAAHDIALDRADLGPLAQRERQHDELRERPLAGVHVAARPGQCDLGLLPLACLAGSDCERSPRECDGLDRRPVGRRTGGALARERLAPVR